MLDSATYEDVERDRSATPQALLVVVLSSLAAGIGARGTGTQTLHFFANASRSSVVSLTASTR